MPDINLMNEWKHKIDQKVDADVDVDSQGRKTPTSSLSEVVCNKQRCEVDLVRDILK